MMLRSKKWLSCSVLHSDEVHDALDDIRRLARKYKDAGSPSLSRKSRHSFLTADVALFRPNAIRFSGVVSLFVVSSLAYSWAGGYIDAAAWADMAVKAVVPIFVLGISVVSLTRALSEAGRFTGEYLNESCKMPLFCCLTLLAGIMAFAGWLMGKIASFPPVVSACVAAGSVGGVIACFAMLAFVIIETIRCLVPNQAIKAVSGFAAAKLCNAYLKEVYVRLLESQHNAYLEKWCVEHGKAIHPPSQYYGHYFRSGLSSDKDNDSCVIPLKGMPSDGNAYKDFHLERLEELERYLNADENRAELYLSSPQYDSERIVLGMLSAPGVATDRQLRAAVERKGNRAVRFRSLAFAEEGDAFWESQQSALAEAIQRAVNDVDPMQVRAYLDAANEPLTVLRQARHHKVVRDAYGEHVRKGYDFLRLYLVALDEILASQEREPKPRAKHASTLARVLLRSVWEETRDILRGMDYHTMELFTWLVPQMYRSIQEAGGKAAPLQSIRAEFGGFYEFADGWLEDAKSEDAEAAGQMRLVLHDGLTKWLLIAIEQKDRELTEQLCDAARMIVFGRGGDITFDRGASVVRHFVLAGYLITHAATEDIRATAIERLFCETYSHDPHVKFDDLVAFYLGNPFPPQAIESYLHIFFKPQEKTTDLLTGSSHSSGCGMTGQHEMALAFLYLGACVLAESRDEPKTIPEDMSFELSDDAMKMVTDLFKGTGVEYGVERLKKWRDACKESSGDAEAKAIADAELSQLKVEEWRKEFWEAYSTSSPVLSMCLRNGHVETDGTAHTDLRYHLLKMAVIDWKYPVAGAGGDDYGRALGGYMEEQLLARAVEKARATRQVDGVLSDLMRRAAAWLRKTGCEDEKGMIVMMTRHGPASQLYRDDNYVPSWRENVQSRGFEGFYEGFPVVWHRQNERKEEGKQEAKEPRRERVVAVDLRGWKGVRARERVITKREFGELTIRTWTEEEIQKALESKELEPRNVNRAKGNCPADVSLYWELSSWPPPHARAFQLPLPEGGASPEDRPRPVEQQETNT
jgi:hypothetical protein